jgi:hypothetical protein
MNMNIITSNQKPTSSTMYRLLSVVKNTALLLVLVSNNRGADAKAASEASSSSSSSAAVIKNNNNNNNYKEPTTTTGWGVVSGKDSASSGPYIPASRPKKLVSVSRRSITFYDDEDHKNLDYGHLVGASFVKSKPKAKKDHHDDTHNNNNNNNHNSH